MQGSIDELINELKRERKSENIAIALNMLLPGAGTVYCGKVTRGIVMFTVTVTFLSANMYNSWIILVIWPLLIVDAKIEAGKFNKTIDADFRDRVIRCPRCNETILTDATVCEYCMVDIDTGKKYGYAKAAFKCLYCKEDIKEDAIKCKHCGADLKKSPQRGDRTLNSKDKSAQSLPMRNGADDLIADLVAKNMSKKFPWRAIRLAVLIFILVVVVVFSILVKAQQQDVRQQDSPSQWAYSMPEYIKDISFQKEGSDGFIVYFTLVEESRLTGANGRVKLTISEEKSDWQGLERKSLEHELYTFERSVTVSDFRKVVLGMGPFERKSIIYSFGRMTYSSFSRKPTESMGKVIIEFTTPDGRVLKGEESIFF